MLIEYVSPFQAQRSACSLQAELEKLRLAENAVASDTEEAQHLKVIWLPCSLVLGVQLREQKPCPSRTKDMISYSWGRWGKIGCYSAGSSLPGAGCELQDG